MFGKNNPDKPKDTSKIETVIGPDTVIQGTISSKSGIRVDGRLEGGVSEASGVIIGENGEIQGDVTVRTAIVGGRLNGNIVASLSIEVLPKAEIHGDIKTASLSIAEGAVFEGNCMMIREKEVVEMDVAAGTKRR